MSPRESFLARARRWLRFQWEHFREWQEHREMATDINFVEDADAEILVQDERGLRAVIWMCCILLLTLIAWAAMARIDEVARGEGKVIPSSQVQVLQSFDGGVVEEILVREGFVVEKDQTLLRIDPTRFVSSLRETTTQLEALQAKAARLQALADGSEFQAPEKLATRLPELVAQEKELFEAEKRRLAAAVGIAEEQLIQRRQELMEVKARYQQARESLELAQQELNVTKPLVQTGAVSNVELLRLEREVSRLRGEKGTAEAQIPRIEAAINEAKQKITEVQLTFANDMRTQLTDVSAKLRAMTEGSEGLADRVKHAEIRSPVRGTVKQMLVNTVGGVVQPFQPVVEIVPLEDNLLLEVRILPKDIAFIRPGQKALVKFTAYDFAVYGGLDATVENIGADTVVDEKGNAFYIVKVRTDSAFLGSARLPIIPGMVAEVDLLTGKRTVLAYLMKPILRATQQALGES
ncbi:HlyD family type I secretion periplasmic adaptor subunit [Permianibacter aggregans]|uniref:Membrane fusion protein (MFP) family protein n=1 Tax=Permianibacter aggregans TaxID=1510150 RepID=A0A4R6UQU9_9GAMM|nr:HlyD family type I secretion periplasmic adaptor subunit [Permianibacter aggregans]QGX39600.1 HlyD family type I secretion periplasmic adaptor subunit [Permianibacter aggregans]TDQ49648.1 adhesin transport system membrane fusion protein [Permianibacter aggregans]